jgi:hypothetical protein
MVAAPMSLTQLIATRPNGANGKGIEGYLAPDLYLPDGLRARILLAFMI